MKYKPLTKTQKKLQKLAFAVRKNSYSPYSDCKVGAALLTASGDIFSGCNVENSSFGGTTCAEQVAIYSAIAAVGATTITEIVIATDASPPWPPCGICRQILTEFTPDPTAVAIHCINPKGEWRSFRLSDLLPEAFTPTDLNKSRRKKRTR